MQRCLTSTELDHGEAYWMLESLVVRTDDFTRIGLLPADQGRRDLDSGPASGSTIPEPIRLKWDPGLVRPQEDPLQAGDPAHARELVAAFREAGVDNMDCYGRRSGTRRRARSTRITWR